MKKTPVVNKVGECDKEEYLINSPTTGVFGAQSHYDNSVSQELSDSRSEGAGAFVYQFLTALVKGRLQ